VGVGMGVSVSVEVGVSACAGVETGRGSSVAWLGLRRLVKNRSMRELERRPAGLAAAVLSFETGCCPFGGAVT
jgi:hypothetical protein